MTRRPFIRLRFIPRSVTGTEIMFEYLSIKGVALIEELALPVKPGLTVLTGETGAGKSIIVDALQLVLGEKADTSMVRTGEEAATVEAAFSLPAEEPEPSGTNDREVILGREVRRQGKGRATLNGSLVTVSQLKELGDRLVDLHGQHEHQSLLKVSTHLDTLDAYAGLMEPRREHAELFRELAGIRERISSIVTGRQERLARVDYLRYVVREIETAAIEPEEEDRLREEARVLASAERLLDTTGSVLEAIYQSEEPLSDGVGRCAGSLRSLAAVDPRLTEVAQLLESARAQLEEGAHQLRDYMNRVETDPDRLAAVNDRLVLIADLKRKYGPEIADIQETLKKSQEELDRFEADDVDLDSLKKREEELAGRVSLAAEALSYQRREAAEGLEKRVQKELADLAMDKVRFKVHFQEVGATESGIDQAEYLISPNPGEPLLPLRKIASGGELSRIMLSLKRILAGSHRVRTLVFDEVDSGIGGRVAAVLGQKLREIAGSHQVLCVTHLAPVAACADHHILVEKRQTGERTTIHARYLSREERVQELARMMGGMEVTSGIIDSARELLEGARG